MNNTRLETEQSNHWTFSLVVDGETTVLTWVPAKGFLSHRNDKPSDMNDPVALFAVEAAAAYRIAQIKKEFSQNPAFLTVQSELNEQGTPFSEMQDILHGLAVNELAVRAASGEYIGQTDSLHLTAKLASRYVRGDHNGLRACTLLSAAGRLKAIGLEYLPVPA